MFNSFIIIALNYENNFIESFIADFYYPIFEGVKLSENIHFGYFERFLVNRFFHFFAHFVVIVVILIAQRDAILYKNKIIF